MKHGTILSIFVLAVALALTGCQAEPTDAADRTELHQQVNSALRSMEGADAGMQGFVSRAEGYVLFPTVGKGGFIVAGSYGRGEVYEKGAFVGYADITQLTVGAQAGGESFAELIVFGDRDSLELFKTGQTTLTANASAIIIKTGAATAATYQNGMAIFIEPNGGAMVEAAVGGQKFSFTPKQR